MRRSALENVRAHLRFVSRIGHSHAVSMCACPTALTRCASSTGRLREHRARARRARRPPVAATSRAVDRDARATSSASNTSAARLLGRGQRRASSFGEHEHVEVERLDLAVARPRARPAPSRRSASPSKSAMSNGHGVVSHGGTGLAAASIRRSTASPPAADRATTYSRCLKCRPWRGLVAVPHQALGGEAHHVGAGAAEIEERHDLRALPVGRDRRPASGTTWCPTRRPTARPTANGS